MTETNAPLKPCPQCGKPSQFEFRPFCSARCKQVDLGKWFNEAYVIPGEPAAVDSDENLD